MPAPETDLTVAVTGPTGTFGSGLLPLLEADDRVAEVVGIARRPFDPAEHGWRKLTYRQGDVRDPGSLEDAFAGAEVVVHLAFLVASTAPRDVTGGVRPRGDDRRSIGHQEVARAGETAGRPGRHRRGGSHL